MNLVDILQWKIPSPLQQIQPSSAVAFSESKCINLRVKRDDLIHPVVSGNKARKLKTLALRWLKDKPECVMSMGGNRSNFLHALGFLCYQLDIPLIANIRGHRPEVFSSTLNDLQQWQTQLEFIDKQSFRELRDNADLAQHLARQSGALWVPEGGSEKSALDGLIEAVNELSDEPDSIFVPVGTGATALGLALGVAQRQWKTRVIGVVVVRGADYLQQSLRKLCLDAGQKWPEQLILEYEFCGKGFGKIDDQLLSRQARYEKTLNLPLEPVYLTKCCDAFEFYCQNKPEMIGKNSILWHTGGLQGSRD